MSITSHPRPLLLCLFAFAWTACGEAPVIADASLRDAEMVACAERPALEDCQFGLFHATCGDTEGGPTLACHERYGTCSWFDGACVPAGYRASDCFPSACCHDAPAGTWPFRDAW